jgi:ABC-type uncharacterized transport system permease subunit
MLDLLTGIFAMLFYTGLAVWQWQHWRQRTTPNRSWLLGGAAVALLLHSVSVYTLIDTDQGFHFGFFRVSSLIFWVIGITVVISSIRLPVENLLPPLFFCAAISIASSLFINTPYKPINTLSYPIAAHILLSILAYSMLTIACVQAIALDLQDKLLRGKQWQRAMATLPPLQTMEALLFEMLWAGTVLLGLSIITGLLFFEDLRSQHLIHKMFFSLIALLVYCTLLWGRHFHGWRGKKAIRWTLGGFVALMLAYFGTKLVLELILAKT